MTSDLPPNGWKHFNVKNMYWVGELEVNTAPQAYYPKTTPLGGSMSNRPITDVGKALSHSDSGLRACSAVSRLMGLVGTDLSPIYEILQICLLRGA